VHRTCRRFASSLAALAAALLAVVVAAPPARADHDHPPAGPPAAEGGGPVALGDLIPSLFDRTIVLAATGHQAHFLGSGAALREAGLQINGSILSQLTNYPVTTSAGGFTYSFDPTLGVMTRSTASFGPIFSERAETIGKGKWNFGVKYLRFDYDAIDDLDLEDGDIALSFTHLDTNNDGTTVATVYEGDLILANARLSLTNDTTVVSAHVGLSERFDVTVAVPLVRVDLEAALDTRVNRLATEGFEDPPAHLFSDGSDEATFLAEGSASGVGDVVVRGKWNFSSQPGRGMAAALDLRLPTGDEDELLGSGATQARLLLIGSASFGTFSPHVNAGYSFYEGEGPQGFDLPEEASFSVGFDWGVHPRVTIAADLLWRTLFDAQQLQVDQATHLYRRWDETAISSTQRPVLTTERDDLNLYSGALGCKVNLWGQVLLTANLLVSLSDDGLQDESFIPLLGLDYSF
jgi:hypothetical protein